MPSNSDETQVENKRPIVTTVSAGILAEAADVAKYSYYARQGERLEVETTTSPTHAIVGAYSAVGNASVSGSATENGTGNTSNNNNNSNNSNRNNNNNGNYSSNGKSRVGNGSNTLGLGLGGATGATLGTRLNAFSLSPSASGRLSAPPPTTTTASSPTDDTTPTTPAAKELQIYSDESSAINPIRNMFAWAAKNDNDDDDEDFVYTTDSQQQFRRSYSQRAAGAYTSPINNNVNHSHNHIHNHTHKHTHSTNYKHSSNTSSSNSNSDDNAPTARLPLAQRLRPNSTPLPVTNTLSSHIANTPATTGTTATLLGSQSPAQSVSVVLSITQAVKSPSTPLLKKDRALKQMPGQIGNHPDANEVKNQQQSPLMGSGSSAVSSLPMGADFITHNLYRRSSSSKSQHNQNKTRSLHHPHHPVLFSEDDDSLNKDGFLNGANAPGYNSQLYYHRPVLQKRMKISTTGSVGSNSSDNRKKRVVGANLYQSSAYFTTEPSIMDGLSGRKRIPSGSAISATYNGAGMQVTERTRLLGTPHHIGGWNGNNLEIDGGGRFMVSVSVEDDMVSSPVSGRNMPFSNQRRFSCCGTMLALITFLLSFVLLLSNPLTPLAPSEKAQPWILPADKWQPIVTRISNSSSDLYAFELELMAVNWGLVWDVSLGGANLEVFVEASGEIGTPNQNFKVSSNAELLAHIAQLDKPAIFPPHSVTFDAKARIAIDHPSNTVGKM
ncbi:hypothetical protein HK100_002370 [Physocladia obscura]|uniref:Uncharacterized protein n=1 Tax=Physocladia obscura TaxID=109957 RepID=A0AAD5SVG9_9FUNG|nr:hypothetical protein HK100_002370 [Physocladia obscura]